MPEGQKWDKLEGKEDKTVAPYPVAREVDIDSLSEDELQELERRERLVRLLSSKIPERRENGERLSLRVDTPDVDAKITVPGDGSVEVYD